MKKKITPDIVKHVAKLANIPLQVSRTETFSNQLSEVIDYNISLLEKVDTENVEPTAHITGAFNIQREDETEPGLSQEEALSNTKNKHNNFFKVKAILEHG